MIYVVKFFREDDLYLYDTVTDKLKSVKLNELVGLVDFVYGVKMENNVVRCERYWYTEDKRLLKLAVLSGVKLYTYGGRLYYVECDRYKTIRVSDYCLVLSDRLFSSRLVCLELDDFVEVPNAFKDIANVSFNLDRVTNSRLAQYIYCSIIRWYAQLDGFIQDSNKERFGLYTAILNLYRGKKDSLKEYIDDFLSIFKLDFIGVLNECKENGWDGSMVELPSVLGNIWDFYSYLLFRFIEYESKALIKIEEMLLEG